MDTKGHDTVGHKGEDTIGHKGHDAVIEYKGRIHAFAKPMFYTEKMFLDRCWFVVRNVTVPDIEALADIWICARYHGVRYDKTVMDRLQKCENIAV